MKKLFAFFTLILVILLYGLFLSQYSLRIIQDTLVPENPSGFNDYKGVINIHSLRSTGSGTIDEVVRAAKNADLDFIVFNELNTFESTHSAPRYYEDLLVSFDHEYSYRNARVLNVMSESGLSYENSAQAQMLLPNLFQQTTDEHGQLFVVAHPLKPRFQWQGDLPQGILGIEIINLKTIWQKAWLEKKISFFWTLFTYIFNDRLALMRLFDGGEQEIQYWDELNNKQRVVAFAGSDAESRLKVSSDGYLRFPSYETLLSLTSNHLLLRSELTGDAKADQVKLKQAFMSGHFYMSFDELANPKGFLATIEDPSGNENLMGSELKFEEGMELVVSLPQKPDVPFDVNIYRNGNKEFTSNSKVTRWVVHEPGVYRVLVRVIPTFPIPDGKKWIPWIYTNAFYVR